ncbi:hypothetical protein DZG01_05290 [Pseudomonas fluorescens]|nr:hypothetical protein DZG01_05290 [Pseudomonas fluorescens]
MHRRWPGVSDPRIKGMHSSRSNSRSHPTENTLETGAGFRTRQSLMPHPDCKYSRFSPGLCANASIYRSSLPDGAAPGLTRRPTDIPRIITKHIRDESAAAHNPKKP